LPRLILNADDFGWSEGVNEAVCALYDAGVLTSASLMVGGPAAGDAIRRARARPGLAMGLHLAVVQSPPVAPPEQVPRLLDRKGWLRASCAAAAGRFVFSRAARRELETELRAQFEAFDRTGLPWSHVDFHVHMSLVPPVFHAALALCRRYPVVGLRVPQDNWAAYRRLYPQEALRQAANAVYFQVACSHQRRALRSERLVTTSRCYGFFRSGRLDERYLEAVVRGLPEGDHELHCHPDLATRAGRREYEALRSRAFREALAARGVELATYSRLGLTRSVSADAAGGV
jgi:hopanoid biosynthesis associated protein HpnK